VGLPSFIAMFTKYFHRNLFCAWWNRYTPPVRKILSLDPILCMMKQVHTSCSQDPVTWPYSVHDKTGTPLLFARSCHLTLFCAWWNRYTPPVRKILSLDPILCMMKQVHPSCLQDPVTWPYSLHDETGTPLLFARSCHLTLFFAWWNRYTPPVRKILSLDPILCQMKPVHTTHVLFMIWYDIY